MAKKPEAPATAAIREAIKRQADTRLQRDALLMAAVPFVAAARGYTDMADGVNPEEIEFKVLDAEGNTRTALITRADIEALAKAAGV